MPEWERHSQSLTSPWVPLKGEEYMSSPSFLWLGESCLYCISPQDWKRDMTSL